MSWPYLGLRGEGQQTTKGASCLGTGPLPSRRHVWVIAATSHLSSTGMDPQSTNKPLVLQVCLYLAPLPLSFRAIRAVLDCK